MNSTSGIEIVRYYKTFEEWYELDICPRSRELDFSTESTFRKMYVLPSHTKERTTTQHHLDIMHLRSSITGATGANATQTAYLAGGWV